MKDENRRHTLAPFLTSSAFLAAALIALRYFYGKTFFIPFRLLELTLALPLLLSWLAVLFCRELRLPQRKPAPGADAGAPPEAAKPHRRAKFRARASLLWYYIRRGFALGYNKSREILRLLTSLGAIGFLSYRFSRW